MQRHDNIPVNLNTFRTLLEVQTSATSLVDFAVSNGLNYQMLVALRRGRQLAVTPANLAKLANVFGVEAETLKA